MCNNDWIQVNINERVDVVNIFDLSILLEGLGLNRSVIMRVPIPNYDDQTLKSSYIQINIYGVSIRFIIEEMHIDLSHSFSTIGINHFFMQDMSCMEDLPVSPKIEDSIVSRFRTSTPIPDYLPHIDQTCYLPSVSDCRLPELLYNGHWNSRFQPQISNLEIGEQLYTQRLQNDNLVDEEVLNCMENILQIVSEDKYLLNDLDISDYCSFISALGSPRNDITNNENCINNSLLQITGFSSVLQHLEQNGSEIVNETRLSLPTLERESGCEIEYNAENQPTNSNLEEYSPIENDSHVTATKIGSEDFKFCTIGLISSSSDDNFLKPVRTKRLWKEETYFTSKRHTAFCYRKNCGKRLTFFFKSCYKVFHEHARIHHDKKLYKCVECRFRDFTQIEISKHYRKAHAGKCTGGSPFHIDLATPSELILIENLTRKCFPHYFAEYCFRNKKSKAEKSPEPVE